MNALDWSIRCAVVLSMVGLGSCVTDGPTSTGKPTCDFTTPTPDSVTLGNLAVRARMACAEVHDSASGTQSLCSRSVLILDSLHGTSALQSLARSGIELTVDGRKVLVGEGSFAGANPEAGQCGYYAWPFEVSIGGLPRDSSFTLAMTQGKLRREWPVTYFYDSASRPEIVVVSTDSTLTVQVARSAPGRVSELVLFTRRGDIDLLPLRSAGDSSRYVVRFSDAKPLNQSTDSATLERESFRITGQVEDSSVQMMVAQISTLGTSRLSVELPISVMDDIISYRRKFCVDCR